MCAAPVQERHCGVRPEGHHLYEIALDTLRLGVERAGTVDLRRAVHPVERGAEPLAVAGPCEVQQTREDDAFWIEVRIQVITRPPQHESATCRFVGKCGERRTALRAVLPYIELANMRFEPSQECRHHEARNQRVLEKLERLECPGRGHVEHR